MCFRWFLLRQLDHCRVSLRSNVDIQKLREGEVIDCVYGLIHKMSQGLLGLCCSIETRDRIEIITITAVLFE